MDLLNEKGEKNGRQKHIISRYKAILGIGWKQRSMMKIENVARG